MDTRTSAKWKQEELMGLLKENFAKQQSGTFTTKELAAKKILALIKPEYIEEFKQAQEHFEKSM